MKILLFEDKKGIIYGDDPRRIESSMDGVLKIGNVEIAVKGGKENVLPVLFYGVSGSYDASFQAGGEIYELERVTVVNGRISAPPSYIAEIMKLKYRADETDAAISAIKRDIEKLYNIFDTNSLNYLIKGEQEE